MPNGLKTDETLMNFRIPISTKDAFITKARENRTTASALMLEFVETYLAGEIPVNIAERKGDVVLTREVSDLKERVNKLEETLERFKDAYRKAYPEKSPS